MIGLEAAILEEARLLRALGQGLRWTAELARAHPAGEGAEIDLDGVQRARQCRAVYTAFAQLGHDPPRPETAPGPRPRVAGREAAVILEAATGEIVQRGLDDGAIEAARAELAFELAAAVLAARQRRYRQLLGFADACVAQASASSAAASSSSATCVGATSVWPRMAASISCAVSGCSLKYWRTFSLP